MKARLLQLGFGQEWERQKRRTRRFLIVGLTCNIAVSTVAVLAWMATVTRELPVVTLRASDTPVCHQWREYVAGEWSEIQVRAWVYELIDATMVYDSQLITENLITATSRMSQHLRAQFQHSAVMQEHFARIASANLKGRMREESLVIDCGNIRFLPSSAPWRCIAYGRAEYSPALALPAKKVKPIDGYFFVRMAIRPGQVTMKNPLGLEAVEFRPHEAATKEDLVLLIAEEQQ